jgi:DNA-directed RNA polymerase specialized sigma subunit
MKEPIQVVDLSEKLSVRRDTSAEEIYFLEIVKDRMLSRLTDRKKFIFLYCFDLGRSQRDAAQVLGLHETNVSRAIKQIRKILAPFK